MTEISERTRLTQLIEKEAKDLWNGDQDAVRQYSLTHGIPLTIERSTSFNADPRKIGILRMVARVRVCGAYEWEIIEVIGSDPIFFLKGEIPVEKRVKMVPVHERPYYDRPRWDDNDPYPTNGPNPGWGG